MNHRNWLYELESLHSCAWWHCVELGVGARYGYSTLLVNVG